jgi:hypothetical protein
MLIAATRLLAPYRSRASTTSIGAEPVAAGYWTSPLHLPFGAPFKALLAPSIEL